VFGAPQVFNERPELKHRPVVCLYALLAVPVAVVFAASSAVRDEAITAFDASSAIHRFA
jgi:hypothetical protein